VGTDGPDNARIYLPSTTKDDKMKNRGQKSSWSKYLILFQNPAGGFGRPLQNIEL
jgi:hypothetical protein